MEIRRVEPTIKVTRIKNRYHARLMFEGKILDEMACSDKSDIGWICREMLRWFDKSSFCISEFAIAARKRHNLILSGHGQVWYRNQLKRESCLQYKN